MLHKAPVKLKPNDLSSYFLVHITSACIFWGYEILQYLFSWVCLTHRYTSFCMFNCIYWFQNTFIWNKTCQIVHSGHSCQQHPVEWTVHICSSIPWAPAVQPALKVFAQATTQTVMVKVQFLADTRSHTAFVLVSARPVTQKLSSPCCQQVIITRGHHEGHEAQEEGHPHECLVQRPQTDLLLVPEFLPYQGILLFLL